MPDRIEAIKSLYAGFNRRDIDAVLALLSPEVEWANAMEGGYVRGHAGIRAYWTRQWSLVSPRVEPVGFKEAGADTIAVEVIQTISDLAGKPLQQSHGLKDKTVTHMFRFAGPLVVRFDVADG